MKVLHVIWDLGQGGAQTFLYELLQQHLSLSDITSEVLVLAKKGYLGEKIEGLGIPITCLGLRSGKDLLGIAKLYSYLRQSNHDIIHSHSPNLAFNCILWKASALKIFTEHGGGLMGGGWKDRLIYKIFESNYCRFIAISNEMANVMKVANSKITDKMRVVHNGLDLRKIDAIVPDNNDKLPETVIHSNYRVGIIGRLVPQKGISTFLEAAAILSKLRKDIVFLIIGDGPLREELQAKAKRLGIESRVYFLGYRVDAKQILKLFDVFLFTSEWEPFGLVIIEAMAAGVPVVALNLKGAVHEIVADNINGFVVDKRDPGLLAKRVLELLDNSKLRAYFVQNARKKVESHFTIEHNAKAILNIYQECLCDAQEVIKGR